MCVRAYVRGCVHACVLVYTYVHTYVFLHKKEDVLCMPVVNVFLFFLSRYFEHFS